MLNCQNREMSLKTILAKKLLHTTCRDQTKVAGGVEWRLRPDKTKLVRLEQPITLIGGQYLKYENQLA